MKNYGILFSLFIACTIVPGWRDNAYIRAVFNMVRDATTITKMHNGKTLTAPSMSIIARFNAEEITAKKGESIGKTYIIESPNGRDTGAFFEKNDGKTLQFFHMNRGVGPDELKKEIEDCIQDDPDFPPNNWGPASDKKKACEALAHIIQLYHELVPNPINKSTEGFAHEIKISSYGKKDLPDKESLYHGVGDLVNKKLIQKKPDSELKFYEGKPIPEELAQEIDNLAKFIFEMAAANAKKEVKKA